MLGLDTIPVVHAENLTKEQIAALRIADNKLSEKALWDNEALGEELKEIADAIDMTDFGFGDFELTILTGDFEPEPFHDDETAEYSERSEKFLHSKRVIITYTDESEEVLQGILGLEEIKKVVYDVSELV